METNHTIWNPLSSHVEMWRRATASIPKSEARRVGRATFLNAVEFGLVLILPVLTLGCDAMREAQSDADLMANFAANRTTFEQMLRMATEDQELSAVAPDHESSKSDALGAGRVSNERIREYRRLLAIADVPIGFFRPGYWAGDPDIDVVAFYSSATGSAVSTGEQKGYVHSPVPLSPVFPNLDDKTPFRMLDSRGFRYLGDGWYLFFQVS